MTSLAHVGITCNALQDRPCLKCKRRQVKCDFAVPSCQRCMRDGLHCPGYIRVRQWKPDRMQRRRPWQGKHVIQTTTRPIPKLDRDFNSGYNAMSVSLDTDAEFRLLLHCAGYLNSRVLRINTPAYPPFQRQAIPIEICAMMPKLFQNVIIFLASTLQITIHTTTDPLEVQDLCIRRGSCLTQLNAAIRARSQSLDLTVMLGCILTLMQTEMQICATSEAWNAHFCAARHIINSQAGIRRCLQEYSGIQGLLVHFSIVDIFAASTSHSDALHLANLTSQRDYFQLEDTWERLLIAHSFAVPKDVARAIVETNIGRCILKDDLAHESTLMLLSAFDSATWARRMITYHQTLPLGPDECSRASASLPAWTALGQAYKLAAILYAVLSCRPPCVSPLFPMRGTLKTALAQQLQFLLSLAQPDDPDGAIETQLWKFVAWPFFIAAYAGVAWDLGDDGPEKEMERLRATGSAMGWRPMRVDAIALLQAIVDLKARQAPGEWTWDAGFAGGTQKWAFIV